MLPTCQVETEHPHPSQGGLSTVGKSHQLFALITKLLFLFHFLFVWPSLLLDIAITCPWTLCFPLHFFFSVRTQKAQLAECEKIFNDFTKSVLD